MKVLMFGWEFPPFNSGGLGTACFGLTKALSKNNVEITFVLPTKVDIDVDFLKIICSGSGDEIKKKYLVNSLLTAYSTCESYDCRLSSAKKQKKGFYGSSLFDEVERYGEIGEEIAMDGGFDVIHAHDWLTVPAAISAKRVSGKCLVLHIHATEFDRGGGDNINSRVYEIEKKGMEEADIVVAVSNLTRNRIINSYGISPEKVKVVHNAVEFENYTLEKMHELRKTKKIVLFLGRLTLQKGPDYFVYAAKKVLEFYPDVVFVVAGSGDMERAIIEKVAELGISDKFIFTGFLRGKDIYEAYRMADLYILPSVSEPFGITPLEALSCGTPVLISNQSGVSEVLDHCLKTDFWDVDEMANKIVAVLNNEDLYHELRENGTREVTKFNWGEPAMRCVDIYEKLIRGKK
ncbi:glycosyltransferase family 4 protein [Candidatus Pacearchaeota archaeon]|nr:glycosyltransferase family 4 protein [Candidatus Pacearchaeota archaeon]